MRVEAEWQDIEDIELDEEGIREDAEEAARAHMRRKGLARGENLKGISKRLSDRHEDGL